jgi:hypothetical protein
VTGFSAWLLSYTRNNRIGDLASDVRRDPPGAAWGYRELKQHMLDRRACRDAMMALEATKRAYLRAFDGRC